MNAPPNDDDQSQEHPHSGIGFGLAAYLWWGTVMPIYTKAVTDVYILEVLAHRVLWSFLIMLLFMMWRGRWKKLLVALKDGRTLKLLLASTVVILFNWLGFLYAVFTERLSDASLGYYINPLVNVFLGFLILGERLRRYQIIALALAITGVLIQIIGLGRLPWISVFLAFSFGSYGLFRKMAPVQATSGLFFETGLLLGPAMLILVYLSRHSGLAIIEGPVSMQILLPLAGIVTATPLVLFSLAARRLKLSTVGFLQYITPTLQLLIAVFAFGEPFEPIKFLSFATIWTALGIYTWDLWKNRGEG